VPLAPVADTYAGPYLLGTRQKNCPYCSADIGPVEHNGHLIPVDPDADPDADHDGEVPLHQADPEATVLCRACRGSLTHLMTALTHDPVEE